MKNFFKKSLEILVRLREQLFSRLFKALHLLCFDGIYRSGILLLLQPISQSSKIYGGWRSWVIFFSSFSLLPIAVPYSPWIFSVSILDYYFFNFFFFLFYLFIFIFSAHMHCRLSFRVTPKYF